MHRQCIYIHAGEALTHSFHFLPMMDFNLELEAEQAFLLMLLLAGYFNTAEMRLEHGPTERMEANAEIPYCLCLGQKK